MNIFIRIISNFNGIKSAKAAGMFLKTKLLSFVLIILNHTTPVPKNKQNRKEKRSNFFMREFVKGSLNPLTKNENILINKMSKVIIKRSQIYRHDGGAINLNIKITISVFFCNISSISDDFPENIALFVSFIQIHVLNSFCLLYTSPSPRDKRQSRMPSSA